MRNVRYEELLPHQIVEAREEGPSAYIAIGGVEWHGEHNCVGLDTVKANALAIRCAEAAGGLRFPPLFYGENREAYLMETGHDPGDRIKEKMGLPVENFAPGYMGVSVQETDERYIELLVHIMREIASLGFKVITIIAGHYPLRNHGTAAAEWFNLMCRDTGARAWCTSGYDLVRDEIPEAGDHAAAWETSLMMAMLPELVDLSRLPEDLDEKLIGVSGRDPREHASVEFGQRGVDAVVAAITARATQMLEEMT
jgi:creatinine amidohydrolase